MVFIHDRFMNVKILCTQNAVIMQENGALGLIYYIIIIIIKCVIIKHVYNIKYYVNMSLLYYYYLLLINNNYMSIHKYYDYDTVNAQSIVYYIII